jgi:hypothetical protein
MIFMAFSDFKTIFDVSETYQTILDKQKLFEKVAPFSLSAEFLEDLEYCLELKKPNPSEIAVSENLISPIIRHIAKRHRHINIWSREFDLQADDKLFGTPNYLFSYTETPAMLNRSMPLICVSEAKVDNFTNAWGQTLAEMVACQILYPTMIIYGFASNGTSWEFAKLENNVFVQDTNTYNIANQAEKIAGLLNHIFTEAVGEAERYLTQKRENKK